MNTFIFDSYEFDPITSVASFRYGFEDGQAFEERIELTASTTGYDEAAMERALFLAFMLIGVSYYKTFPSQQVSIRHGGLDAWQADFFNHVYQEGLSQYAFENNLERGSLAQFSASRDEAVSAVAYQGQGILSLQSGGKDSLLVATLLSESQRAFSSFYVTSSGSHPQILETLGDELISTRRILDTQALTEASQRGGLNGHVPVTYIVMSIALLQAILLGKNTILAAIGHEGEEPHDWIGDLPVNHQWSKTWAAEQLFAEYVAKYVSPDVRIGSPLRQYSELEIARLFTEKAWGKYALSFSSCNVANYRQGAHNDQLTWCGECPKCANSFLLFAAYVEPEELTKLFGGDLFEKTLLTNTFKGLLGVDGFMKPFECVGEIGELRYAYHLSQQKGYAALPFEVPAAQYDAAFRYPSQDFSDVVTEDLS